MIQTPWIGCVQTLEKNKTKTEEDFPWFPPTKTNADIENDPDQQSIASFDGIPPMQSPVPSEPEEPLSDIESNASDPNANPGYDLFNSDSEDEFSLT